MNEILGCTRCGAVSRSDSLDGKPECPECGARMGRISLEEARRYVATRRRNEERLRAQLAAAEIGLSPAPEVA
jgi:hypothetical protein